MQLVRFPSAAKQSFVILPHWQEETSEQENDWGGANKIKKGIIKTLNESETIRVDDNSLLTLVQSGTAWVAAPHAAHLLMGIAVFVLSFPPPPARRLRAPGLSTRVREKRESQAQVAQDQPEGFGL